MIVSIIHLSDFHFIEGQGNNYALNRLEKLALAINSKIMGVKNVFVVVTGDVAQSGKENEYEIAESFFTRLESVIQDDGKRNVRTIFIPGNHDCDLSNSQDIRKLVLDDIPVKYGSGENLDEYVKICLAAQKNYWEFVARFSHEEFLDEKLHLFSTRIEEIESKKICFNLLNSSWMSSINRGGDQGKLIYPIDYIENGGEFDSQFDIVISLLHHPYTWYESNNSRDLRKKLEDISDVVLTGHEHISDSYGKAIVEGYDIEYIEGGVFQNTNGRTKESEFIVINLDVKNKEQQISKFTWSKCKENFYQNGEIVNKKFIRNIGRPTSGFVLNSVFEKILEDVGINFTHSKIDTIYQSDIFVEPYLIQINEFPDQKLGNIVIKTPVYQHILDNHRVIIFGGEKSGKTSIAKRIFTSFFKNGKLPLIVNGFELNRFNNRQVLSTLQKVVSNTYKKPKENLYFQSPKKERIVIIDDFNKSRLNEDGRSKLIQTLQEMFEYIIIFSTPDLRFSEIVVGEEDNSSSYGLPQFEIIGMGHAKRAELIKKWYRLGENQYFVDKEEFSRTYVEAEKTISFLLGKNYIPPYPFYILVILQQLEAGKPVNASAGSYGYLYESVLTLSLSKVSTESIQLDVFYSYLSELAYHFYLKKISVVPEEKISVWHDIFCRKFDLTISLDTILQNLFKAALLKKEVTGIRFHYPYIYYYFIARYLRDHLRENKETIRYMSLHLHQEDSANILIFLSYLSKDPFILKTLLGKSKQLFKDYSEFNLLENTKFLSQMINEIPNLVLSGEQTEQNHLSELEKRDEIEMKMSDRHDDEDFIEKSDSDLDEFLQINVAFKNIQIIGQLMKNYPGSWTASQKYSMAFECYSLGLRVLSYIFEAVENKHGRIINNLYSILKQENPHWDSDKVYKGIENVVVSVLEGMAFYVINHIADSVGHRDFSLVFDKIYTANSRNISYQFIDLEIKFGRYFDFPEGQVLQLSKSIRKNNFSSFLLKHMVWYYFYIYRVKHDVRDRVCKKLGISITPQLIAGNK